MKTKEVERGREIEEQEEERKGAEGKAIFCSGSLKDPEILWFREAGSKETKIGDVGFSEKANTSEVGTNTLNLKMSGLEAEIGSRDIRGAKYKLTSEHSDDLSLDSRLYQRYMLFDEFNIFLLFKG
ncbi:hypothetical protein HZH68_010517 [Vespula germanica]|uniref:Uncharacterized protein n=1 Tax=Vespula germanica TaxID=30212 RepID=A0A834JRY0_VESGE|nr:hypothetical protein HZH68_010517 [Vespula germanica]